MKITRHWSMPSHETFSIKPIAELLARHLKEKDVVVDPFARNSQIGTHTNDLNPQTKAKWHLHAEQFCEMLFKEGVVANIVLYDPPFSPRQTKECYQGFGMKPTQSDTQGFHTVKRQLDKLLRPGGLAICCGWNSVGFGKTWGYERIETMLVSHGGNRNDTIITVDRKLPPVSRQKKSQSASGPYLALAG